MRVFAFALACAASVVTLTAAASDPYPAKPVRVIVPFPAGSPVETLMRAVGERLRESAGQGFVVEARPGASGNIAAEAASRAAPDGYTLFAATQGVMTINPHLFPRLTFDPLRDFAPITLVGRSHMFLVVHPSVNARTLPEFVAWAKANKGKASFASIGAGTPSHFIGMLFAQVAGIDLLHIPYKGSVPAATDVLAGVVPSGFLPLGAIRPQLQSGKLRVLAVTAGARSASLPDVPTFKELGYPAIETYTWSGLAAPAKTPVEIIERLNREVTRALASPDLVERLAASDQEPAPMTPAEFERLIRADSARWAKVIRDTGFKLDN